MTETNLNPLSISQIKIDKLFGALDYTIPLENSDISRLLILYGDNGTGKTTVLKLIFYILSTKDKSGYKSKIAETKFKKISIFFNNGYEIGVSRENEFIGSFKYYIKRKNKEIKSILLKTNLKNAIKLEPGSKEDDEFRDFLVFLRSLNITTFYLSDNRKILNTLTSNDNSDDFDKIILDADIYYTNNKRRNVSDEKSEVLHEAIEKLMSWIKTRVISGSKAGEKNSQTIFSDIIKDYINLSSTNNLIEKNILIEHLDSFDVKLPPFVNLGLIESFDSKIIRNSIKKAKEEEQLRFISTIINPFLDGLNAKLNALAGVESTLTLFINTVNEYFSNKTLSFNLTDGFLMTNNLGDPINFDWLSSGEKQLLLLIINIITSAEDATLYIIDEPEISLNIKWQRKLLKTLLEFSKDKNIQFIVATHSFEILAAHKTQICKLTNINNGKEKTLGTNNNLSTGRGIN